MAIDLDSGDRTVVSDDARGAGPSFDAVVLVSHDPEGDRVVVVSYDYRRTMRPAIMTIDPATGDRALVSWDSGSHGSGPFPWLPYFLGGAGDRAFVLSGDTGLAGLFHIDLVSGDRVIVSK